MITIKINEATFDMTEQDFAALVFMAVPEYMRDSNTPAPDETSDLIRGAVKSMMALIGNKLMFNIYGKDAPVFARKQDRLPGMWKAMCDWIIAQIRAKDIEIQAIEIEPDEAHYRIVAVLAKPLHPQYEEPLQEQATTETAAAT